jgi:hypothetical protein
VFMEDAKGWGEERWKALGRPYADG